ncbi:MAG TPA: ABC transporter ATP-binding protein [Acidimicrobiales bacterium]|nr:ABC transporter ATP-binding protein [Acidimicrobiales bacterium]
MARSPVVSARALSKRFGDFVAVDAIDFDIWPGEVFGFLGPNGAGKSSTMRMIGCMSPPTSGELRVRGLDPATDGPEIRAHLGVVPQDDALDDQLTVFDNLRVYARYFDIPRREARARAAELLSFAQLEGRGDDRVDQLSGGMRRRLTIARALISRPELVIMDEPSTGLDPQARHLVWERLHRLKREGVTQIVTTHYMDEAEQLCDRLVVMDHGRIVASGSPRELIRAHVSREVVEIRVEDGDYRSLIEELAPLAERTEQLADRLCCYVADGDALVAALSKIDPRDLHPLVRRASLEDVFLALTGRTLVD